MAWMIWAHCAGVIDFGRMAVTIVPLIVCAMAKADRIPSNARPRPRLPLGKLASITYVSGTAGAGPDHGNVT